MNYKEKVRKYYQEAITTLPMNTDLRAALKTNERVPMFIDKVAYELKDANEIISHRRGHPLKESTIKEFVFEMTGIFIRGLESQATKMHESDLAKRQREDKIQYQKDLEETANGKPQGIFEEFGVKEITDANRTPDQIQS